MAFAGSKCKKRTLLEKELSGKVLPVQRMSRKFIQWGALMSATAMLLGVSACAEEPQREPYAGETSVVRVAIDSQTTEQWVVGELYMRVLGKNGRESVPFLPGEDSSTKNALDSLTTGKADLIIGCAGQLLQDLHPEAAQQLSEEYTKALDEGVSPNDGQWRERVYSELVNSLPGVLAATDPSNAVGCDEETQPKLPQNIVPVYRKPILDREERLVLNSVTGTLTTDDVDSLVAVVEETGSVSAAITPYIQQHGL